MDLLHLVRFAFSIFVLRNFWKIFAFLNQFKSFFQLQSTSRIDKWLWSVRLFKTRTLAADACKGGKIKLNGTVTKASKEIKNGDEISFKSGIITKIIRVKDFPSNRIAAKFVNDFMEDLTPADEYEKLRLMKELGPPVFHVGKGRPTKKDRRRIDPFI